MKLRVLTAILSLAICAISMTGCHHHHHHSNHDYDAYNYHRDRAVYSNGYKQGYRAAKKDDRQHYNSHGSNKNHYNNHRNNSSWWNWN